MSIELTPHAKGSFDILHAQAADNVAVADAANTTIAASGLYRIVATSACRVRMGEGITSSVGGEWWPAGCIEVRALRNGMKIYVSAT